MSGDDKWGKKRIGHQPIIHRMKHSDPLFDEIKKDGSLKGKFKTPKDMTIVTCHNYKELPLLEQNLQFLGLEYVVLKEERVPFKYVYKIEQMVKFMETTCARTPYILFCDALDVIIVDDPKRIIEIFENQKCDLFFGSTLSKCGWMCMLDKRKWALDTVVKMDCYRYLNSGVYIGRWDFTLEVLKEVCRYIHPDSITIPEYEIAGRGERDYRLCKILPDFPHRAPDQDILRFIHPQFYPRMNYDVKNELVYRN